MARIKKNSLVFWNDPAIDDFEPKDRQKQLDRVFRVVSINSEEAWILEVGEKVGAEIQVMPHELVPVQNKTPGSTWVVLVWDNLDEYTPEVHGPYASREKAWADALKAAKKDRSMCLGKSKLKIDEDDDRITLEYNAEQYDWKVIEL